MILFYRAILLLFLLTTIIGCKKSHREKFVYYLKVNVEGLKVDSIIPFSKAPINPVEMTAKLQPYIYVNIFDRDAPPPLFQNYWQFQMQVNPDHQGTGVFYPRLMFEGELDHHRYIYVNPGLQTSGDSTVTLTISRSEQGSASDPGVLEAHFSGLIMKRDGITQEDIGVVEINGSFAVPLTGE